jgi:hypothetical protein
LKSADAHRGLDADRSMLSREDRRGAPRTAGKKRTISKIFASGRAISPDLHMRYFGSPQFEALTHGLPVQ